MKRLIFVLIAVSFLLVGCGRETPATIPENVQFVDGVLSWDPAEHAIGYQIYINDFLLDLEDTSYDLRYLENGEYEAWVRVITISSVSPYALPVVVVIDESIEAPTNLRLEGEVLYWDAVVGVDYYQLWINGDTYTVYDEEQFDFESFEVGAYNVQIRTEGRYRTSEYGEMFHVEIRRYLDTPMNLRVEGEWLKWDSVEDATSYEVHFINSSITVVSNQVGLFTYPNGDYDVTIRAIGSTLQSMLTEHFEFEILRTFPHAMNVTIEDDMLSWAGNEQAVSYLVVIDGVEEDVVDETYDLGGLERNQFYDITVIVRYLTADSEPSLVVVYDAYSVLGRLDLQSYNKNTEGDFEVLFDQDILPTLVVLNDVAVENMDWLVEADTLVLEESFLQSVPYGTYWMKVYTSGGFWDFELKVKDDRKPHMLSSNTITYVHNQDIVVEFELYDGEFMSFSGNDITQAHYRIEGSVVTIYASYFEQILLDDPDRSMVILSYYLSSDEHMTIGYLFITTNQP